MEADEQGLITRLRSFLNEVLCSRSTTSETYTWCQLAFPGSCYLSCATSTGTGSFATTSNLIGRGDFQISPIPTQISPASHSLQGAVLHNSWPPQHPELQRLQQSVPWDSVLAVSIPPADSPAPVAAGTTAAATAAAAAARTDRETSPGHFHNRSSSTDPISASEDSSNQTEEAQHSAVATTESVLILGLRGQRLDLERALIKLQMLAHQLTPVMHDHRQQLINQAMHAANTADAAATAVANGGMPDAHMAAASSVSADAEGCADDTEATAVVNAATTEAAPGDLAAPVLSSVPSPFAGLARPLNPVFPGGVERQGRSREQSGTLPLDQILGRNPSPISSVPSKSLDRLYLDEVSRQSSAQPSRLGSDGLREGPTPGHFVPTASTAPTTGQLPQEDVAAGHSSAVATAAPPKILATVFSGQGLPLSSPASSLEPSVSPQAEDYESEPGSSELPQAHDSEPEQRSSDPHRCGKRALPAAAKEDVGEAAIAAVPAGIRLRRESAESKNAEDLIQLKSEAGASHQGRGQQHPWLLYFYDKEIERDYSDYHAKQMLKVDAVSLMMAVGIYLRLGFASGHAYAYKVPVTFGLTLCFLLSLLAGVLCFQDRWIVCRQRALRSFAAVYVGVNGLYLYPRYAKEAFSSAWPWLLRYSNAWVLLMTAVGLMVRFHVHVPLQLINFAISAAILPSAICQAGYAEYALWKCISVGVSLQFLIGVLLSSTLIALNERRLRGMYLRSIGNQSSATATFKAL